MTRFRRAAVVAAGLAAAGLTGCADLRSWTGLSGPTAPTVTTSARPAPGTPQQQDLDRPDQAKAQLAMAAECDKLGKHPDAVLYYEAARQTDPSLVEPTRRRLAVLYDLTGQQSKAMAEFQELLAKHPKDADLLNDVGYSFYMRGQLGEAEKYLRQAVERKPDHKGAWNNLGMVLVHQGKLDEGYTAFVKAIGPAGAYSNIGFQLESRGQKKEAGDCYRKALELDPVLPTAKAGLARLDRPAEEKPDAAETAKGG